ncbi:hypothetical protein HS088_TW06G00520 [Tripterygium wilfordii]|uniref:Exostosin GT47 domain-containing protein n=1 Tax=Tripterygium wilfordii TaxID=458696 RepID=A0A7J7DJ80_TRIWF|nr:probable glycosyltransferase At5g03795 [Tripterygium wilfordii]KAF5746349.1 hypothetical protein HS088_TW06G00520 [Tripterygium wilfordii]
MAKKTSKRRKPTGQLSGEPLLAVFVTALVFVSAFCFFLFVRSIDNGNLPTIQQVNSRSPMKATTFSAVSNFSNAGGQAAVPSARIAVVESGPYHDWKIFAADFRDMMRQLKIFVYPDLYRKVGSFAEIFLAHPNPFNPKIGNYVSEHLFKLALLRSSLITTNPEEAHFFFLPFSVNHLRNDRRVHSEDAIADFVANYVVKISQEFTFWNASAGADHFFVCCHSVGREASSKHPHLHNNAIQVTCSSSYFQRFYIAHKDIGLPQVWPRRDEHPLNPPQARDKLAYFAGRIQNSRVRQELLDLWGNDTDIEVFDKSPLRYEEGFRRSKYCIHAKGYEVNTARLSDAMHYGCIPVIVSNYYDLPFANVLDWTKFSILINQADISLLKKKLLSIPTEAYLAMYHDLCRVRRHFKWHIPPKGYDSFHMTAYQLWLRRGIHRLSH